LGAAACSAGTDPYEDRDFLSFHASVFSSFTLRQMLPTRFGLHQYAREFRLSFPGGLRRQYNWDRLIRAQRIFEIVSRIAGDQGAILHGFGKYAEVIDGVTAGSRRLEELTLPKVGSPTAAQ
jgi:hypothetical protein